jgi:hypothetical protein
MSRRNIVVEGTTYSWSISLPDVHIRHPRGSDKPALRVPVCRPGETRAVLPSMVADIIHRQILGREPPARAETPIVRKDVAPKSIEGWRPDPAGTETYLVSMTWRNWEGYSRNTPLEVHDDPSSAKNYAARLNGILARWKADGAPEGQLHIHATDDDIVVGVDPSHLAMLDRIGGQGAENLKVEASAIPRRAATRVLVIG